MRETKKIMDNKRNLILEIVILFYGSTMIFYSLLPSIVTAGITFLFFAYSYTVLRKEYNIVESLALMSVIAIPTSTISIMGTSYASLPITWYIITIILAVFLICINGKLDRKYFLCAFIFAVAELIQLVLVPNIFNAFKQYLILLLFFFGFLIGKYLKDYSTKSIHYDLYRFYLLGTFCVAFQVFLQRSYILTVGSRIGHYAVMGQSRVAYAGLMGDYSFATLYLASGCLIVLLKHLNTKEIGFAKFVIYEVFLLSAIIAVSSRTGLAALVVTVALYFAFNLRQLNPKLILVLLICIVSIPFLFEKLMASRGSQALLDSSGRLENFAKALSYWEKHPLFGYGLGLENLHAATGLGVPHNFFIQYLVQIGVVGLVLVIIPICRFFINNVLRTNYDKWLFCLIAIGAMFIPDIVSSRYIYGIVLICMTGYCCSDNIERVQEEEI